MNSTIKEIALRQHHVPMYSVYDSYGDVVSKVSHRLSYLRQLLHQAQPWIFSLIQYVGNSCTDAFDDGQYPLCTGE